MLIHALRPCREQQAQKKKKTKSTVQDIRLSRLSPPTCSARLLHNPPETPRQLTVSLPLRPAAPLLLSTATFGPENRLSHGTCLLGHPRGGETEDEKIRVDIIENQAMDFRNGFVTLCYMNFDTQRSCYVEKLPATLKQFSDFLGDRKWFAGDKITFVDFTMYELLDQHRMFEPKCLDDVQKLKDFLSRFEALDKIAAYMKSTKFMKSPVNNKMAKWGNK
uniref:glutathione transferase n=1 Tax=Stegastes partitus TaxID=144197 RepID=A0A3B4ZHW3_9TELE